ncbi:MAG: [FeFe] hydrogenase H-cluster radical SAM maturase HydE [Clostridia bacterium]|nr:[FeFe] hydrogenase H-cluster radical SAM maturase HydE [Clostridia bacterium]
MLKKLDLIQKLAESGNLTDCELKALLQSEDDDSQLFKAADKVRREVYSDEVYIRGLIEFTNYCKNNCYYCGIRCSNKNAVRYRLDREDILECCREGYRLGFRTFVLQGGEDPYYTDEIICDIVSSIRELYPDCAITLSIGEKPKASYKAYFDAGANRYLLRHETANEEHYGKLHPASMSLKNRKQCLYNLKDIGYQVGSGFMVGSPYQTVDNLIQDLRFLQDLQPDMIGIGPYITHKDTPFAEYENGSLAMTLRLISILRLMFPYALIPSTTALGTIDTQGRELGLKAGANVVMPNLSPVKVRKLYSLYENKICTGEEAAQCRGCLERRVESAGYRIVTAIGNVKKGCKKAKTV